MFGNSFGTSNVPTLFGGNQSQNMFNTQSNVTGTPHKFNPLNSSDTIQKGGTNTTIQTKIHSISAMTEYESKSFEELRWEDYQANRKTGNQTLFGGGSSSVFSGSSFSTFNNQQQTQNTYSSNIFNSQPNQLGTFGANKPLFGSNTTNTGFGSVNNAPKPNMFGSTNTQSANKPLFGATSTSTSLFGGNTNQQTNMFGGNQQASSTSNFFGGINKPQPANQPTSFFGNTNQVSNSSFGFNNTSNTPSTGTNLFGTQNTALKPFGNTSSSFGFNTNTNTTNMFGGNQSTSGNLFGQNVQSQQQSVFGASTSKPSLFSTTNTAFNTAQPTATSQNLFQPTTTSAFGVGVGTTTSLFGANQQKTGGSAFGATNLGLGNTGGNLFNTNPQQNTGTSAFGSSMLNPSGNLFNTPAVSNQQNIPVNSVISGPIGFNNPSESYVQQKVSHMKFLKLLNKPYAVNRLFVDPTKPDVVSDDKFLEGNIPNTERLKRNDGEQYSVRRRIFNSNCPLRNYNRLFVGLDDEDDDETTRTSSTTMDRCFLTKREDWKSLPPDAFERSHRRSINSNNSLLNEHFTMTKDNSIPDFPTNYPAISTNSKSNDRNCSTPLPDGNIAVEPELIASPIEKEVPKSNKKYTDESKEKVNENSNLDTSSMSVKVKPVDKVENDVKKPETLIEIFQSGQHLCKVTLTKSDYYISPTVNVLDKLVTTNDCGEKECWVENFVIGRKDYGSIKFLNETNLYGLNLDELVEINKWEVLVYPDDNLKPIEGEGLNKPAQVILHKVFPSDKTNGGLIEDPERLREINFEKKLRKDTENMDAQFLKYRPEDGLWVFEVKHFSKYKFTDASDDENEHVNEILEEDLNEAIVIRKTKEELTVVRAEADSMTDESLQTNLNSYIFNDYSPSKNDASFNIDGYTKMRSALFVENEHINEEEIDVLSERYEFLNKGKLKKPHSDLSTDIKQEEPMTKRFETSEMGCSIMISTVNNSNDSTSMQQLPNSDQEDSKLAMVPYIEPEDPVDVHKPIEIEKPKQTENIASIKYAEGKLFSKVCNKNINLTFNYMHNRLLKYVGNNERNSLHKESVFGNRYRCGLFNSTNGLIFFTKGSINDSAISKCDSKLSSLSLLTKSDHNWLQMKTLRYETDIAIQLDCLKTAISFSKTINTHWSPIKGLSLLKKYVELRFDHSSSDCYMGRIVSLYESLWCDFKEGEHDASESDYFKQLARKQSLSKWIRGQCSYKIKQDLDEYLENNPSKTSVQPCFPLVLECLVSGEIKLASYLASIKQNYRLSLLISQISGSSATYRDIALEQLYLWTQDREDVSINQDLLKIYALLAGQTSLALSDGSIIYVLQGKYWWQAFGCYMWYIMPYLASIKDVLKFYEREFQLEANIPKPNPINMKFADTIESDYKDICFHLINLYTEPAYEIEVLLNPPNISSHHEHVSLLNWFEPWHSSFILISLGYEISCFDKICLEYATQLERMGLWEWAIYVLLHILDDYNREKLISSTILRNIISVSKTLNGKEQFVVEDLQVSKEIIHKGKAMFCKYRFNPELEAYHLFEAKSYEESCRIYCSDVLPHLVINDNFAKISEILNKFNAIKFNKEITDWNSYGQLFFLYLLIQFELKSLSLTHKIAKHHNLRIEINDDSDNSKLDLSSILGCIESVSVDERIEKINQDVKKLEKALENYEPKSEKQIVCSKQMKSMCENVKQCTSITE